MADYASADELARRARPERPTACVRPHRARAAARWFGARFPGRLLYAVKANPAAWALRALHGEGVRWFDVASEPEFEAVAALPDAQCAFMNPVKARAAIVRAYHTRGCRVFALDHADELDKIAAATGAASDLTLMVRLTVSNAAAVLPLETKYGADGAEAVELLRRARRVAARLGVTFHVGSQCMQPAAYAEALARVSALAARAGVTVDIVNVGGGFPCRYPGLTPPPLAAYLRAITEGFAAMSLPKTAELWCEPGRALVAEAESILTAVELRKGDALYLNDGGFGHLYDAAHESWRFPARLIRPDGVSTASLAPFRLYGPTCDSADMAPGPFYLPADVAEGDFLEIGLVGAYGRAMRAGFNGFGGFDEAVVGDAPFASMYDETAAEAAEA